VDYSGVRCPPALDAHTICSKQNKNPPSGTVALLEKAERTSIAAMRSPKGDFLTTHQPKLDMTPSFDLSEELITKPGE
jgi:hypothetical protein